MDSSPTTSRSCRVDPVSWGAGVVTVIIRQNPREHAQWMLMEQVRKHGFSGLIDFLYLPLDFNKGSNVGYGFINFTEPEHALIFRDALDGSCPDRLNIDRSSMHYGATDCVLAGALTGGVTELLRIDLISSSEDSSGMHGLMLFGELLVLDGFAAAFQEKYFNFHLDSLLLKRAAEMPSREASPGDVFYLHSRLLKRAAEMPGREAYPGNVSYWHSR